MDSGLGGSSIFADPQLSSFQITAGTSDTTRPPGDATTERVGKAALRVVALSLGLIVVLEALLLLEAAVGSRFDGPVPFVVDLAQKVPWAIFVCTGVWFGLKMGNGDPPLSLPAGLVAAPLGFVLLRAVAEGAHALTFDSGSVGGPPALVVAAVKGVEYACLGTLVGSLGKRAWTAMPRYAAVGLAAGLVFGGLLLALTAAALPTALDGARVMEWAINEVLFPVGCALILFSALKVERPALPAR